MSKVCCEFTSAGEEAGGDAEEDRGREGREEGEGGEQWQQWGVCQARLGQKSVGVKRINTKKLKYKSRKGSLKL